MTKKQAIQKIKDIIAKDKNFNPSTIKIKFIDKKPKG